MSKPDAGTLYLIAVAVAVVIAVALFILLGTQSPL